MKASEIKIGESYWVSGLKGFTRTGDPTTLRCKAIRVAGEYDVIVETTDLREGCWGYKLAVSPSAMEVAKW